MHSELLPIERMANKQGTEFVASVADDNYDNTYSRQSSAKRQQVVMMTKSQKPLTSKDTSIQVRVSNSIE